MRKMKQHTKHFELRNIYPNAQRGDTKDCVTIKLTTDEGWDLFEQLQQHLRYPQGETFDLVLPGDLVPVKGWYE
jgi:hypothetical protein